MIARRTSPLRLPAFAAALGAGIALCLGQIPPTPAPEAPAETEAPPAAVDRTEALRAILREAITNETVLSSTNPIAFPPPTEPAPTEPAPTTPASPIVRTPATNAIPNLRNLAPPAFPPAPAARPLVQPGVPPGTVAPISPPAPGAPVPNTTAPALPPSGAPPVGYSYSLPAAPLIQVFEMYAELTGRTVLHPSNIQGTVTLNTVGELTREEAVQALQGALALNGITLIPQGDKFVKAVPAQSALQEGGPISADPAVHLPDSDEFVTQIVQLKVAVPSEVSQLLQSFAKTPQGIVPIDSSMILVIRDYATNVRRMLEIIERVDVEVETAYVLEVIPVRYGRVSDLFNTMSALISGSNAGAVGTTPLPTAGVMRTAGNFGAGSRLGAAGGMRARTPANYGGGYGSSYGGSAGYYGGGYNPYSDDLIQLNEPLASSTVRSPTTTPTPGTTGSTFQQRLNNILTRASGGETNQVLGDARIVPDERSNTLIVYANREDMKMITNIVSKVDVLLAQVLIEGIVIAVRMEAGQDVGVSWYQTPKKFGQDFSGAGAINNGFFGALTNFPSASPSGFSYWARIGDDLNVAVQAIATDSKTRILQRPRIQTSHAVPGSFFSGSTVPYVTGYANYGAIAGYGSQSQVSQIQVGVQLDVTPYITPDGLVVLDVFQDISQISGYVKIDNNDVPTTTSRSASASLSVRDGETIMLGGYIDDAKDSSKSGVPLLKDIPLLGALFRASSSGTRRDELILLMKVTVLKNPTDASILAEQERAKLPASMKAGKDFAAP